MTSDALATELIANVQVVQFAYAFPHSAQGSTTGAVTRVGSEQTAAIGRHVCIAHSRDIGRVEMGKNLGRIKSEVARLLRIPASHLLSQLRHLQKLLFGGRLRNLNHV